MSFDSGDQHKNIEWAFDDVALEYDRLLAERDWPANRILFDALGEAACRPQYVLDLGAGTGKTIDTLFAYGEPEHVTAVDISRCMLDQLEAKYTNDPRVTAVHTTVEQYLAGQDGEFDTITAIGTLDFCPDFSGTLGRVAHKLRHNGWLFFTYTPHFPGHPKLGGSEFESIGGMRHYLRPPSVVRAVVRAAGLVPLEEQFFHPAPGVDDPAFMVGFMTARKLR